MALAMVLSSMSMSAFATGTADGSSGSDSSDTTKADEPTYSYVVTGYNITKLNEKTPGTLPTINKGDKVDISVYIKLNSTSEKPRLDEVLRLEDDFSGGKTERIWESGTNKYTINVTDLIYKGTGQSLKFMVENGTGYDTLTVKVVEAKIYTEPTTDDSSSTYTPDPIPAPKAIFTRNDLTKDIKAGETQAVTITVKNVGKANMVSPIITLTPSDALTLVGGSTSFELATINTGKTASITVQVKALSKIESATQYIDAEIAYDYYNRVSTQSATAKGRITIPAKVTTATDTTTNEAGNPVPNVIVTKFSYGGESVAAGNNFNFSFRFKNTSSKLAIDNVVVTVDSGENLMLNGSSNSFFFDKIKAGSSKTVTVPMKALKTLTVNSQTVSVNFKYEYVDQNKRTQATSDAKLSVPVYQPDKFEISQPVLPDYISEGDEVSITLNYVNKSKTQISNVEASLEGDVTSSNSLQTVGNLDAGKSGTIAFAVTADSAGDKEFNIKVSYEDGNGDSKERIFPVTMTVQAAEPYVPDDNIDDGGDSTDETGGFNWWILAAAAVVLAIVITVILKKRKKAKAAKKEQELWDSWDNELNDGGDNNSNAAGDNKGEK